VTQADREAATPLETTTPLADWWLQQQSNPPAFFIQVKLTAASVLVLQDVIITSQ